MDEPNCIVFVVDDDDSVRKGLGRLLRAAGFQVETFASAEAYLGRPPHEGVACLLLDVQMPGVTGLELQARMNKRSDDIPIVFLSGHSDVPMSVQAMKNGATDFLTKPVDEAALLAAVQQSLLRHRESLDAGLAMFQARTAAASLTPREFEVMRCVLSGALNKQIAIHLGITEKTVKIHRGQVMKKMGAGSVADLVRLCERIGIAPAPLS